MLDWKLLAGAAGIVAAVVFVIWLIFFCVRSKQEMESSYVDLTRVIHMDIEEE